MNNFNKVSNWINTSESVEFNFLVLQTAVKARAWAAAWAHKILVQNPLLIAAKKFPSKSKTSATKANMVA